MIVDDIIWAMKTYQRKNNIPDKFIYLSIGMSRTTFTRIKNREINPSFDNAIKILELMGRELELK